MEQKKKRKVKPDRDYETEPDYGITLVCIECGTPEVISGQYAEHHGIDNSNFVCISCNYLYD